MVVSNLPRAKAQGAGPGWLGDEWLPPAAGHSKAVFSTTLSALHKMPQRNAKSVRHSLEVTYKPKETF